MASNLTKGVEIEELVRQAEEIKASGKKFSDSIDPQNHQYVDLVQEGGGILGLALVGYTYILEKAGIRFYSLAGSSAGSINTLLMAGLSKPGEITSEKIIEIINGKNFFDFVDGPQYVRNLIQRKIEGKSIFWKIVINSSRIYRLLKIHLGLNPGNNIEKWLQDIMQKEGIRTFKDLRIKREFIPGLRHRELPGAKFNYPRLAFISSEVTTHTKAEFPKMAELYWNDVDKVSPSQFVRASMSIPFFFYPFTVSGLPNQGEKRVEIWEKFAGYSGVVPPSVKFVDGGMLSNFPINTFHVAGVPSRPTFGVRLSTYRETYSRTNSFFSYSGAMINTMRQIHDYDFILKNPDYNKLICRINANEKFNWLNFGMSEERQKELFLLGATKAVEFLNEFDWDDYKNIRRELNAPQFLL